MRQRQRIDRRHAERRLRTEDEPADKRRRAGGGGDRQEGIDADLGQHQFDREHDAADRRVEGRRDPRPGARRDKRDALPGWHADQLPQGRTQRRADLDDRPLAADRGAAANRQCRRQRLGDRDDRPDAPAIVIDRVHHLGDAVAFRLGRKLRDDKGDADRPNRRHQNDPRPPGVRRGEDAAVVGKAEGPQKEEVVDEADQLAEKERADPGDDADADREKRHPDEPEGTNSDFPAGEWGYPTRPLGVVRFTRQGGIRSRIHSSPRSASTQPR